MKQNESRAFGYVADKVYQNQRVVGYLAEEIDSQEQILLIHEKKVFPSQYTNKRFNFNLEGYSYCCDQLRQAMKSHDTIVIDEVGKLELTHKMGYFSILKDLAQFDGHTYVTIREELLPELTALLKEERHLYKVISMKSVGAILLASGDSKRFGKENKLLTPWNGHTLFEEVLLQVIRSGECSHIVVVSKYEEIKTITKKYKEVTYLHNDFSEEGISASIRLGTQYLHGMVHGYMYIQTDQIGLKSDSIKFLTRCFKNGKADVIMPRYGGKIASPKIFSSILTSELLNLKGDTGARELIKICESKQIVDLEDGTGILDVDTKEDLLNLVHGLKESGD